MTVKGSKVERTVWEDVKNSILKIACLVDINSFTHN